MTSRYLQHNIAAIDPTPGTLRIGHVEPCSLVSGPGRRAVVWVTGCRRRCPGCIKPGFLSFTVGEEIATECLLEHLLSFRDIEGVTFSGGEPFEQAAELARLARGLREAGLTVGSYTGYTLEEIREAGHSMSTLADELNFIIDGEYLRERPGPFRWFGSDNQRMIQIRPGTADPQGHEAVREVQVTVEGDKVTLVGFPDRAFERELRRRLELRGVFLDEESQ